MHNHMTVVVVLPLTRLGFATLWLRESSESARLQLFLQDGMISLYKVMYLMYIIEITIDHC